MATPTIRPATEADLAAITDIYNQAGVGTTASYDLEPVTVEQLARVREQVSGLSWKIEDVVVTVVPRVHDAHRPR